MAFFKTVKNVKELKASDVSMVGASGKIKGSKKPGMVLFYSSYCGYCTMVKPEYMKLGSSSPGYCVYSYQCDNPDNASFVQQMGIAGVPDIRFVSSTGKIDGKKYMGERTAAKFKAFIKSKSKPKSKARSKRKVKKAQTGGRSKKKKVVRRRPGASKKKRVVKRTRRLRVINANKKIKSRPSKMRGMKVEKRTRKFQPFKIQF